MAGGNASCGVNYFCMGAFLIFVGSVLLCALGFTIVLPYAATRHWPEVTCQVTNTTYNFLQCMCDQQIYDEDLGCITKYPCLEILVQYRVNRSVVANVTGLNVHDYADGTTGETTTVHQTEQANGHTDANTTMNVVNDKLATVRTGQEKTGRQTKVPEANTVGKFEADTTSVDDVSPTGTGRDDIDPRSTLPYSGPAMTSHANVPDAAQRGEEPSADTVLVSTTMFRWWSDSFYGKCSLHECGVEEWNVKEAARFKSAWGNIGQRFTCYYQPDSPGVVILAKTPVLVVIHAVFWPALSLISGCLLWLGLCAGCCSLENGETYTPDHYR